MRPFCCAFVILTLSVVAIPLLAGQPTPLEPFQPDDHTLLLYHFDEGQGTVTKDASRFRLDGEIRGAQWTAGRFGKALQFDGQDDSVFHRTTGAIEGLKQLTVECWFKQDDPEGRQFLAGKDVTFHFDLSGGQGTSLSLYNRGAGVANADGLRHQQIGAGLGAVRHGRWHHLAATFDGRQVSFFLDGILKDRKPGAKDFLLGVPSRGLWIGCYVGQDYWFHGKIDEMRVSDCVRYDAENRLQVGQKAFGVPREAPLQRTVRKPRTTGAATLGLTLKPLYGGDASGWVSLKSPGKPAACVGRFSVAAATKQPESRVEVDVSDELAGDGCYVVGLEPTGGSGYFALTDATLRAPGKVLARWSGEVTSRRTFRPPLLVPLRVGPPPAASPSRILLSADGADRLEGDLEIDAAERDEPACLYGEGWAEYWLDIPRDQTYRVYLRYAAMAPRPCDLVIDGVDLHAFNMAARNRTGGGAPRDAFWEYQGTTRLTSGLHWLRLQDVLPEIVAIRLEPVTGSADTAQVAKTLGGPDTFPERTRHAPSTSPENVSGSRSDKRSPSGTPLVAAPPGQTAKLPSPPAPLPHAGEGSPRKDSMAVAIPWQRFAVPEGGFLGRAETWQAEPLFGARRDAAVVLDKSGREPALRLSATLANTDPRELFAGDAVRFVHRGVWDLEPFGRLRFQFHGQGSGHVVSLRAIDLKGDERLLWRTRDVKAGAKDISVPISFEGNDVFDPGRVVGLAWELDEGNVKSQTVNRLTATIRGLVFDRRDAIVPPEGYPEKLAQARQAMARPGAKPGAGASPLVSPGFRPWTRPLVPEEHPLFAKTEPKPVTRKTLGYDLHSTGARSIDADSLDKFHKLYDFGDVCWPHIGICPLRSAFAKEADYRAALATMEKRLEEVKRRGLFVFDIWGYVPYQPEFPWKIAPEHHEILLRVLGDRFLGYDNGEQDGRYIGAFAGRGKHTNRKEGWDDFVRWDEHVCNDSMNYMNATGSLNFSHYYAERNCRTLGLETAQGLPSDTLMFAFLRGAGKQYGRLLTQATSIWNRYGYNMYHARKTDGPGGYGYGPNKGCSPSLHKRLFLSSYLGGHSIVGTETSQFTADQLPNGAPELSPLGRQHLELREFFKRHPDRGVMYTPVALMLDFYNGWNMPRHLYRGDKYKIWGKLPYEKGDYLIDGLFRTIWPGYEDCSYLRNERGFLTPTPFGDIFDVVTNRCHPSVLGQYTAVMLLGDVEISPEVAGKLVDFVRGGGDLVLDARHGNLLPENVTGVKLGAESQACMSRVLCGGETFEEQPYTYTKSTLAGATPLVVNEHGDALMTVHPAGKGRVIVGMADYWMTNPLQYRTPEIVNMEPPYRILKGVQAVLARYFDSFSPVQIEPAGLGISTCCYDGDAKRLLVGLMNHDLFADWRGTLRVRVGQVGSARELRSEKTLSVQDPLPLAVPAGDAVLLDVRMK